MADDVASTMVSAADAPSRIDARAKVTGQAQYASDMRTANPAFARLVTSAIARGRIAALHLEDAARTPGVLEILTYENTRDDVREAKFFSEGGRASTTIRPLSSDRIWHDGQIVAMVVADTMEAATEAAYRVRITYESEPAAASFGSDGVETRAAAEETKGHDDPQVGNAATGLASAAAVIDAAYATPTQHHNPIELFTTTCAWQGDELTVYEPSQFVYGLKNGLAEQLGISAERVRVVSPYVGGAFGSKGSVTPRTALVAIAARRVGRPVKLETTRAQGFTVATYRAETRQTVRIGASRTGELVGLIHEGLEVTSRPDPYVVAGTDTTARMYACPNVATSVSIVHADRNTPGFMRSPPETPYMYGLEHAMDELAVELKMDPVRLRLINDTKTEPINGLPYTSRSLVECFEAASAAFGWSDRTPEPGSMADGDWLIGWGCATATYPTHIAPAAARVRFDSDGRVRVEMAAHEIGNGAYTVAAQIAAERLGVPLEKVEVALGDTRLPPAPVAGGSNTTASMCNAIARACDAIKDRIAVGARYLGLSAGDDNAAGNAVPTKISLANGRVVAQNGTDIGSIEDAFNRLNVTMIEEYAENIPDGSSRDAMQKLYRGSSAIIGGTRLKDRVEFAFGAEFVEVRIHKRTREIRVPRIVGAFAAGRIINAKTARNQLIGGMIWGLSSALHEETIVDRGSARYVNTNLADYLVPVNADIEDVDVIFIPEQDDKVNPLGIKGLGELGNVGTAAAVASAVYHATGRRVRDLPIRLEKLLV